MWIYLIVWSIGMFVILESSRKTGRIPLGGLRTKEWPIERLFQNGEWPWPFTKLPKLQSTNGQSKLNLELTLGQYGIGPNPNLKLALILI